MAKKKEKDLEETVMEQTKGAFKLVGKVVNIDRESAYQEKVSEKGKMKGKTYRSLRFGIQTSSNNIVQVSMFSFKPEEVYIWDSEKKSGGKMSYENWKKNRKVLEKQKKLPLQTAIGIDRDEEGKSLTQHLPTWDAIEYIYNNLNNGTSVMTQGDISYNTYERNGQTETSTNLNLSRLFSLKKPVDFDDEDFEETSVFTQTFVFEGAELDKKVKKTFVFGKTIGYAKEGEIPPLTDVSFEINYNNDNEDQTIAKMAQVYAKHVPYGSLLEIHGNVVNRAVTEIVEDDDDEEDEILAMMSGEKNRMETTTRYERAMEIRGTVSMERGKYTEEQLSQDDSLIEDDEDDEELGDLLGEKNSKSKKKKEEILDDDDEDDDFGFDDMSDSDLPF